MTQTALITVTVIYKTVNIPNGAAGTRATLKVMARIVKRYKKSPQIRELALRIVQDLPSKKFRAEVDRVFKYVRDNIRYVKDVQGCETLHTPIQILRIGQGDCDDQSILSASLLASLGHPTRFVAVGFVRRGNYSHVFTQTKIGGQWVTLDCTMENWRLGQMPRQKIKAQMVEHN